MGCVGGVCVEWGVCVGGGGEVVLGLGEEKRVRERVVASVVCAHICVNACVCG